MTFLEAKNYYDQILNVSTCRCLLGRESKLKKVKITAFDRFSAYIDFFFENITEKFTNSDIKVLYSDIELNPKNLKSEPKNFKVKRNKKQQLYNDEKKRLKECGRCHQIYPYKNFGRYKSEERNGLRSNCKDCRSELQVINELTKKFNLLTNYFEPNCSICATNLLEILPAASFHHRNENKKTYTWSYGKEKAHSNQKISDELKGDDAVQVCENCHRAETASIFKRYKAFILWNELFNHSSEEICNMIEDQIEDLSIEKKSHTRTNIKRFIRKRYVYEKLFDGSCIGCGKITIEQLPAFDGHHIKQFYEKSLWKEIGDNDCEDIINIFVKEGIIGLCANCHRIFHSVYHKYVEEVCESYYSGLKSVVREKYYQILRNIESFQYNLESDFISPLKTNNFALQEAWKLHLIQIYYGVLKLKINSFRRSDFEVFNHINLRNLTEWIPRYEERNFIEIEKPITSQYRYYRFTDDGIDIINEILSENYEKSINEKEKIFSYNTSPIIRSLRHRVFMMYHKNSKMPFDVFYQTFFEKESRKRINTYWNLAIKWFFENEDD